MKKILIFILSLIVCFSLIGVVSTSFAEEITEEISEEITQEEEISEETTETEETEETEEITETEETETEETETEETEEDLTYEEFVDKVTNKLDEWGLKDIVQLLIDTGFLSALFGVYLKYRKYKNNSIEDVVTAIKEHTQEAVKENFESLSTEKLQNLVNSVETLEKANETIMKVLVLMQDNTSKGKVALLDYLGTKTTSEAVKEAVTETTETLENTEKVKEEVKKTVTTDYNTIF